MSQPPNTTRDQQGPKPPKQTTVRVTLTPTPGEAEIRIPTTPPPLEAPALTSYRAAARTAQAAQTEGEQQVAVGAPQLRAPELKLESAPAPASNKTPAALRAPRSNRSTWGV